jgi:uncharacterized protein (AIM24 family)
MAPAFPGDVRQMRLEHETLLVQSGSYMASTGDIASIRSGVGEDGCT